MSDETRKNVGQWIGIGATLVAGAVGYGELRSRVASNGENLRANWAADTAFRESSASSEQAFREQMLANMAEVKAQLALLLQDRAARR